jgi:hypothetical protein
MDLWVGYTLMIILLLCMYLFLLIDKGQPVSVLDFIVYIICIILWPIVLAVAILSTITTLIFYNHNSDEDEFTL